MEFKPMSGREFPRFSAIKTFFRLPHVLIHDKFDIALTGVPFDGGATYRPGQRFGPTKVREVSSLGRAYHWGRGVDVFSRLKVADIGDCPTVPIDLNHTYEKVEKYFAAILKTGKRFVAVGGDHSITLPILRAIHKHTKEQISLIHFDAHLDTYPAAWGCEYHHGAFARHAVEEGLINPKTSVQIGVRGPLSGGEDLDFVKKHGLTTVTMDDIREDGAGKVSKRFPKFKGPVYITYDIDCLDPAFAPGTGTPVPGGLTTYEAQQIFRSLKIDNLIGGDVVELAPPYDTADISALAALDAVFEILCLF